MSDDKYRLEAQALVADWRDSTPATFNSRERNLHLQHRIENALAKSVREAMERAADLQTALQNLFDACIVADSHGDLSEAIDGSLLDAARKAIEKADEIRKEANQIDPKE
jgi:hypothetical protein